MKGGRNVWVGIKKAVDDAGKGFDSCDVMYKAYDKHWNFVDKPSDDGTPGEILKKKYVQSAIEIAKNCDPVAWNAAYEKQDLKQESEMNEKLNGFMDEFENQLNPLEAEPYDSPLNIGEKRKARGFSRNDAGWVKVEAVMDSGCNQSVAPPEMCPDYEIRESPGSKRGQNFVSASKDVIPNVGEQVLNVVTEDGSEGKVKYQIAEISRPLTAVSDVCDAGNRVIFGKKLWIDLQHHKWKGNIFSEEGRELCFKLLCSSE